MFAQQRGRMAASYFRDKVVRVLLEKAEVLFRKTHARQHMLASTSSPAHRRQHIVASTTRDGIVSVTIAATVSDHDDARRVLWSTTI